jgi:hypothetical protein
MPGEKLTARRYENGFEIIGNREGLRGLADVCLALAALPEDVDASRKAGNHYHFDEDMNNLEPGSVPFVILYKPDL